MFICIGGAYLDRVRFESVPVGCKCQTEWKENIMKINEVRIITESNINYRNAVNLDNGNLIPVDSSQWVWIADDVKLCS